jgi:hypothetical protein
LENFASGSLSIFDAASDYTAKQQFIDEGAPLYAKDFALLVVR